MNMPRRSAAPARVQGDAQGSSAQALSNLRIGPFYENWCRTFADTLFMGCEATAPDAARPLAYPLASAPPPRPPGYLCCDQRSEFGCQPGLTPTNSTGSLPDVVPFDSISGWPGDWVWQVAGQVIPHGVLLAEGNVQVLALLWPYISAQMSFAATASAGDDGLLKFGPYSDWLALEPVSASFAQNFYLVFAAQLAAEMATALGQTREAIVYTAMADAKSAAMVAALFNATSGTWDHSSNMNAQSMALARSLGGAAVAPYRALIAEAMVADFLKHQGHPTGGVTSIRWILQGLTAGNRSDLALAMALEPSSPGWAYMSTPDMPGTIWENWNGNATRSDGSKNHPMFSGGIGVWFYQTALGLSFRHVLRGGGNDPEVGRRLRSAPYHLGYDPRHSGLSDAETLVALALADDIRSGIVPAAMHELLQRVAYYGAVDRVPPGLEPVCTASPDAAIVRALGSASGFREAPQGRCELRWNLDAGSGAFELAATFPSGLLGRLGLPLALLEAAPHISLWHDGELLLDAELHVGNGRATSASGRAMSEPGLADCASLGVVEGRDLQLCSAALQALPRLSSWAELEGEGRIDFGGVSWETGGLLFEFTGPGNYVLHAKAQ
jgi:hypothetical protein